ncbi:uncharacterized protein I206_102089 [Kwoniella pini CBS 10737]|uniref:Uncharacterized protein n=1 Tax=Kwoniella pini CBS 10737 TaxID=1296096 RepID=A0A1B9HUU9_9TREE|nr:uncharacterized protein I206_06818 [Kwoniella pini CBS 10737]OCF47044.1 hypothetical protein I206_06818 [Kwoniella pini CBS 10737]
MGGNAFGVPAQRLSHAQYSILKTHVHEALSPLFDQILTPRNLSSKNDHGDLDVLAQYSQALPYGDEEYIPAPDPLLLEVINNLALKPALAPRTVLKELRGSNSGGEFKVWGTGKMDNVKDEDVDRVRNLCGQIRESIGATAWRRRGSEVSFKVPCYMIDRQHEGSDQFFQVDVIFVRPENIHFHYMMSSYSSTGLLLGRLVRHYSKNLTLHLTHLIIRHSPYPGISPIDVTLTSSPEEFCKWFGLDYQAWQDAGENGWAEIEDLWKWLTNVSDDSIAAQAIRKITYRRNRPSINDELAGKRKKRSEFADGLYDWLNLQPKWTSEVSEENQEAQIVCPEPSIPSPADQGVKEEDLSVSDQKVMISSTSESKSPAPAISDIQLGKLEMSRLHLDLRSTAALEYWGKQEKYDQVLDERKAAADLLAGRQKERVEKKEEDQKTEETQVNNE